MAERERKHCLCFLLCWRLKALCSHSSQLCSLAVSRQLRVHNSQCCKSAVSPRDGKQDEAAERDSWADLGCFTWENKTARTGESPRSSDVWATSVWRELTWNRSASDKAEPLVPAPGSPSVKCSSLSTCRVRWECLLGGLRDSVWRPRALRNPV